MTIDVRIANLLESDAQTLVNTVNTVGVMGKGIALDFKKRFPAMFDDYAERCKRNEVRLGKPYPYYLPDGRIILNFPTKDHWRSVSRLDAIVSGLKLLEANYKRWGITSIAVPPLGCGNGQLEWRVVGPTLHRYLSRLEIPVELYAPYGTPEPQLQLRFFEDGGLAEAGDHAAADRVAPEALALVEALARVTSKRFHWPVGRIRLQKLAYFLSAVGVPLDVEYRRSSYGPYAAHLKPILARLLNNGLIEERKRRNMFAVSVGPTYEDARNAYAGELAKWDSQIDRVTDLFARLRTDQTEVAATIHFASRELAKRLGRTPSEADVLDEVMAWKARRRPPLDRDEVAAVIRSLAMLRWIDVEPSRELGDDELLLVGGSAGSRRL
jgi:uncharacterized protein YwgA/O-acetyl-ADP-ribose deacetylase (regulator of RNase III)